MGPNKVKDGKNFLDCGKYARYTPEQVEILERVYNDCPKPSSSRRQQLIRECPILANIGQKQLKVWFQNRRCREKQRKETSRLQNWNSKLNAMNQILLEENERLQKQAAQLSLENQYLRQQLQLQQPNMDLSQHVSHPVIMANTDTSSESVVTSGQHQKSPRHPSQECSLSQLSVIAERILAEFLAKVTESGIPLPGMKPGPDSIGAIALPRPAGGVAAQACGFVNLEAMKVAEIVKDRLLWLQDCRKMEVLATFAADHGGLVELVHTQMYAPTSLVPPRDFWTLRYTCCLEDGSLVVCERSLRSGQGIQEIPIAPGCLRAEMLSSGCLIRPVGHGGSMVMVVDDMSFKSGNNISEGLQPLFTSSFMFAKRMTLKVLCHLRSVVKERPSNESITSISTLRALSHRLVRGFNDAINCFPDEGWVSIINNGPGTVSVQIKPPSIYKLISVTQVAAGLRGGIVCAKADLILQGVPAIVLVRFIRECWIDWIDFDGGICPSDNTQKKKLGAIPVLQPAAGLDEVLEVVRLEKPHPAGDCKSRTDNFCLQFMSGMEDLDTNVHAQLIFAPIDASIPDDAPLLPSGFCIMHLDSHSENGCSSETLDLASSLEDRTTVIRGQAQCVGGGSILLALAFQYMYEVDSHDVIALKARRHVQALIDSIQHMAMSSRPRCSPLTDSQYSIEALMLVQQITDSYRFYLGQELLSCVGVAEMLFKSFWTFRHAIICCAWKPLPEFIFANHTALEMLETNSSALGNISVAKTFRHSLLKTDYSQPPLFIQEEGCIHLPAGVCISSTGSPITFEQATGWKVITNDLSIPVAAFMFSNWSFGAAREV